MVKPPLRKLDVSTGLPKRGDYQIVMIRRVDAGPASAVLAEHVREAFHELRY